MNDEATNEAKPMSSIPQLEEVIVKSDFDRIVGKAQLVWAALPSLDYDKLHDELAHLNISISDTPSLQKIAQDLVAIQGVLTRAAQIRIQADRDYTTKHSIVKALTSGWVKFSSESSQDKRKAEAEVKMWQFLEALTEAEVLYNASTSIVENLNCKYEAISRLFSIFQLQVKLLDTSRVMPDSPFLQNISPFEAGQEEDSGEVTGGKKSLPKWEEAPDGA